MITICAAPAVGEPPARVPSHRPWRRLAGIGVTAALCAALAGCGLPRSGPMLGEMQDAGQRGAIDLVDVTPALARASQWSDRESFPAAFLSAQPTDYDQLEAGDSVHIMIWEHDGLGVFPTGQNGVTDFGDLTLDRTGHIALPYLGSVRAAGLTPAQLHDVLAKRLDQLVLGSDVSVQRANSGGQMVVARGDVDKPGSYPIDHAMQRLSDLLAQVAPDRRDPAQLVVTVRRNGVSGSVPLNALYRDARQDIALRPGDRVVVHDLANRVTVLGAAGLQGTVPLNRQQFSVLDVLGQVHGLNDSLANPRAVFLLKADDSAATDARPVIYRFDFTRPQQMALAGQFMVHDRDALYISDAPFTQVRKLLSVFSGTLGTVQSANTLAQ